VETQGKPVLSAGSDVESLLGMDRQERLEQYLRSQTAVT
jgi:hypothetical protein